MYALSLELQLRPNSIDEFICTVEEKVTPILRAQIGFQDEFTIAFPGSRDVLAISLWNTADDIKAYQRNAFFQVLELIEKFMVGGPSIQHVESVGFDFWQ